MATPSLKDLPKVAVDLKSQLESFSPDSLKNASTEEKFVLPTAEGKNNGKIFLHKRKSNFLLKKCLKNLKNSFFFGVVSGCSGRTSRG